MNWTASNLLPMHLSSRRRAPPDIYERGLSLSPKREGLNQVSESTQKSQERTVNSRFVSSNYILLVPNVLDIRPGISNVLFKFFKLLFCVRLRRVGNPRIVYSSLVAPDDILFMPELSILSCWEFAHRLEFFLRVRLCLV